MNSEQSVISTELNREQIINAVCLHLEGLGLYRNREIIELEIFGLPKTETIPITFKLNGGKSQETSLAN